MQRQPVLGVIGGSGLYSLPGATFVQSHELKTPFGSPSDPVTEITLGGSSVFFLPRHGKGHRFLPSEVNYRANVYALKKLGCTHVLAVSAVGIMREDIRPGDLVIPSQLFDRTKGIRASTFFGSGIAGHVTFADPFCVEFSEVLLSAANAVGKRVHQGGTYVCMEGPAFSTRAESHFYRAALQPSVIGMTALPEAKLAREAEMAYAMLALATDYDCWHESEEDVSVTAVVQVLKANATAAQDVIAKLLPSLPRTWSCSCLTAAKYAVMTAPDAIPAAAKDRVRELWGHYLG